MSVSVTVFQQEELDAIEEKWIVPRLIFVPGGPICIAILGAQWPTAHWGWQTGWTLLATYLFFCWTSCFHETAHQTLTSARGVSIWFGRLIGTLMFVPYTVYRESHIRHHAYLNKPNDWELWPYSDPNASLRFRRAFVWFDLIFGFLGAPVTYGRLFFHKDSPITSPKMRAVVRYEYLSSIVFWSLVVGAVAWYGAWAGFLRAWIIPYYLTGVVQVARKLTEHLGMSSYDPLLGTRTVIGTNFLTRFATYLNFDIFVHGPHHRHPRIAHNQLEKKMQAYIESDPQTDYPVFSTYGRAFVNMAPYLFKNPGVGMNAGADRPQDEKQPDVQNFLADVSAEVLADSDVVVSQSVV